VEAGAGAGGANDVDALIERARTGGTQVVVDVPGGEGDPLFLKFLPSVDAVVLVAAYDRTGKHPLLRMADLIRRHGGRIAGHVDPRRAARGLARAVDRLVRDPRDPDRPARTAGDLLLVSPQHRPRAETDGSDPEQAHLQRLQRSVAHAVPCSSPSLRNMSLMPRTACRVRFSFSIIAKRT